MSQILQNMSSDIRHDHGVKVGQLGEHLTKNMT